MVVIFIKTAHDSGLTLIRLNHSELVSLVIKQSKCALAEFDNGEHDDKQLKNYSLNCKHKQLVAPADAPDN